MFKRQENKLKAQLQDKLGLAAEETLMIWSGPSFWIFAVLAAVVGGVLAGVLDIGGAIGGAIIGAIVGSWFLVAKPSLLARTSDEIVLVRMDQPPFGQASPEEIVRRDPLDSAPVSRTRSTLRYGEDEYDLLPLQGARADRVIGSRQSAAG